MAGETDKPDDKPSGLGNFFSDLVSNFYTKEDGVKLPALLGGGLIAIVGWLFGGGTGALIGAAAGFLLGGPLNEFLGGLLGGSGPKNMSKVKTSVKQRSESVDLGNGHKIEVETVVPTVINKGAPITATSVDQYLQQTAAGLHAKKEGNDPEARTAFQEAAVARDGVREHVAFALKYHDQATAIIGVERKKDIAELVRAMSEMGKYTVTPEKLDEMRQAADKAIPKPPTLSAESLKTLTERGISYTVVATGETLYLDQQAARATAKTNNSLTKGQQLELQNMNNVDKLLLVHNYYAQEHTRLKGAIDWTAAEAAFGEGNKRGWYNVIGWFEGKGAAVKDGRDEFGKLEEGAIKDRLAKLDEYSGYIKSTDEVKKIRELILMEAKIASVQKVIGDMKPAVAETIALNERASAENADALKDFAAYAAEFKTTGNLVTKVVQKTKDNSPNQQDSTFIENYNAQSGQYTVVVINNTLGKATHYYTGSMDQTSFNLFDAGSWGHFKEIANGGVDAKDFLSGSSETKAKTFTKIISTIQSGPFAANQSQQQPVAASQTADELQRLAAGILPIAGVSHTGSGISGILEEGVPSTGTAKKVAVAKPVPPAVEGGAPGTSAGAGIRLT
jgi:hypothetical protein